MITFTAMKQRNKENSFNESYDVYR